MTVDRDAASDLSTGIYILCAAFGSTCVILLFAGCMWCRDRWKKLTHRQYRLSNSVHEASLPPTEQNLTEFTLFPPQSTTTHHLPTGFSVDEVVFEPLPEIRSRHLGPVSANVRPARFTGSYGKVSLQDWFDEHQTNFPRNQLKYFREVGATWYGQAVEGEARDMGQGEEKTKVVVKILRVDATATEHMQYLQETRPFRDLSHPHLLRLLGRCLEVQPFLLIMEHCAMDLKSYLIEQRKMAELLLQNGLLLRMACNVAAALQHMHECGFVHTDVACRSCLVTSDLTVKVGDYGTAVHLYKEDFYCLGDVAFPIRWCAPESLMCTETMIEAKDITSEANIWSFGVLLWEILEFGKLPYIGLSDDEVILKVLIECCLKLEQPKTPCVHSDMIYKIMQLCWVPASLRPNIQKVATLLNYLYDNRDVLSESTAFETRWNALQQQKSVPREHNLQNPQTTVPMRFESDFISKSRDCDSVRSSEFDSTNNCYGDKSPSSGSFSIGYEPEFSSDISPSLLNLRGSIEDLMPSDNANNDHHSDRRSLKTTLSADNDSRGDRQSLKVTLSTDTYGRGDPQSFEMTLPADQGDRQSLEVTLSGQGDSHSLKTTLSADTAYGQGSQSLEMTLPVGQGDRQSLEVTVQGDQQSAEKNLRHAQQSVEMTPLDDRQSLEMTQQADDDDRGDRQNLEVTLSADNDYRGDQQSLEMTLPADNDLESDVELRISEAINDLDTILAEEPTSSDTSKCNTPEKSAFFQKFEEFKEPCDYSKVNGSEGHFVKPKSELDGDVCITLSDSD